VEIVLNIIKKTKIALNIIKKTKIALNIIKKTKIALNIIKNLSNNTHEKSMFYQINFFGITGPEDS
jgi:hypothetical protein